MGYLAPVVFGLSVVSIAPVRYWRQRQHRRTLAVHCPKCESRHLTDIIGEDDPPEMSMLGDHFECLDCGLERESLEDRGETLVAALAELQELDYPLSRVENMRRDWLLDVGPDNNYRQAGDPELIRERQSQLQDVWKTIRTIRRDYPSAFGAPLPDGGAGAKTAGARVEQFDPDTLGHVEPEVTHVFIFQDLWVKTRRLTDQTE